VQVEQTPDDGPLADDRAHVVQQLTLAVVGAVTHLSAVQAQPDDVDVARGTQFVEDAVTDLVPDVVGGRQRRLCRGERSRDQFEAEIAHHLARLAVPEAEGGRPGVYPPANGVERAERGGDGRERAALVLDPGDEDAHGAGR
jgi:hypothetical protein